MLQAMDQSEFGQFVADLWERQGWQTQVKRDDGRVFVAVQRPATGDEGLLWAIADDGELGGKHVQKFASLCEGYDVDEAAIVTAGTLSDHAEKVAQGTDIELLDGEGIEMVLKRKELTDLAEKYGSDAAAGGDAGDGGDDEDDSPLDQLQAVGERALSTVTGLVGDADLSGTPVVAVVVVALLAAGVLFGPSLPFLGGGGGGPVSAESVSAANATTTLHVAWNAKVVQTIDPNESDGLVYRAPSGEQFVLVRMSINNTGENETALKQSAFVLRTANRTYGYQPLADHDGFLDFPASPGQHYVGWTAFTVPEGSTVTLTYDQNATSAPVTVEFERDSSLPVNVTQL